MSRKTIEFMELLNNQTIPDEIMREEDVLTIRYGDDEGIEFVVTVVERRNREVDETFGDPSSFIEYVYDTLQEELKHTLDDAEFPDDYPKLTFHKGSIYVVPNDPSVQSLIRLTAVEVLQSEIPDFEDKQPGKSSPTDCW